MANMTTQAVQDLALCAARVHWLTLACALLVGCLQPEEVDFVEARPIPPCSEVAAPGWQVSTFSDFVHRVDDSAPQSLAVPDRLLRSTGAGLATADLDEDGHLDLLFTSHVGGNRVFRGLGDGRFEPVTGTGLELEQGTWTSVAIADIDGDGRLDVSLGGLEDLRLLLGSGEFQFVDATAELGIQPSTGVASTLAWADFDGDQDLDLYAGWAPLVEYGEMQNTPTGKDALWRQDADGFTNLGDSFPREATTDGFVFEAKWRDFDQDGDLDLLLLHDFGDYHNSELWENRGPLGEGWGWFDRLPSSGLGVLRSPMGSALIDLDGDGMRDLWISNRGNNRIFRQIAPFTFVDVSMIWGQNVPMNIAHVSWSVLSLDPLSSGRPGVYVGYGPLEDSGHGAHFLAEQADRFWLPPDQATPVPIFQAADDLLSGLLNGNARGAVRGDINGDGAADVVIANIGQAASLLLSRCTQSHRIVVDLHDPGSMNPRAAGARVTVTVGEQVQTETVSAGGRGTHSSSEHALFFGLGDAELATLQVHWPDGEQTVFDTDCVRCRLRVSRP